MTKRPGRGFGGPAGGMGGGQAGMMRQFQKMQEDMQKAQEALAEEVMDITAGGGAVTITISGHQRIKAIKIDPAALDTSDPEWATDLQDLLVIAVNQAVEESQKRAAERMETITGNLNGMLPGGLGGLFG
jgi:hypothetical protein